MKVFKENKRQSGKVTNIFMVLLLSIVFFYSCRQDAPSEKEREQKVSWKLICIGDGITAGVGLDPDFAFPALIKNKCTSGSIDGVKVVNAGIKGETIRGVDQRIEWMLQQRFDAILFSFRSQELTKEALIFWEHCFDKIRTTNPEAIILIGIVSQTESIINIESYFSDLAKEYSIKLIDLQLPDNDEVNWWQPNLLFPTKEGQQELANRLFEYLDL